MLKLFLSTSVHRIDKKGRVSIPAAFRNVLGTEIEQGIALTRTLENLPCIEGCRMSRIEAYAERLEHLNPHSVEFHALATTVLAEMKPASVDTEGRIVLPEEFMAVANLSDRALFAGLGKTFRIWEPEAYEMHRIQALEIARKNYNLMSESSHSVSGSGANNA